MRVRQAAMVAAATLAILGTAACTADTPGRGKGGATPAPATAGTASAQASPPGQLRAALLTRAQLPRGFELHTEAVNSTTTGAPHGPASTVPITAMPCHELAVESFLTRHAPPVEDVAVGLEGPADDVWEGQEALDRYAPGQAAAVIAAIRAAAQRCAAYPDTLTDGTRIQTTLTVTRAEVPGDDGLVLRTASLYPGDPDPFIGEAAFVREGDVILMVQKIVTQKPASGVEAVLPAAVAAYRASPAG